MLKLKLQYFGYLMQRTDSLKKTLMPGRLEEKGTIEDEMVGWHFRLNGDEFEQALGVGDGQRNLLCCSPWDFPGKNTRVGFYFLLLKKAKHQRTDAFELWC